MSKLIALDDGHGMETPGKRSDVVPELGRRIKENEFNREVVKYLDKELRNNGFKTLLTAPTDSDTPLSTRTNLANSKNADLFISIHFNALDGKFGSNDPEGFSAHVYLNNSNTQSGKFAKIALKHLAKGTKQKNRGLKEQNLHVVRETKMPAVLFELGFMDNLKEARLMLNVGFQKECAVELAKAVCEFYGVAYRTSKAQPSVKPNDKTTTSGTSTHKVKSGDTLWAVSRKYSVSVANLKSWNGLKSNLIKPGQTLKVQAPKVVAKKKLLKVKVSSLWTYNTANWNDKAQIVHKNDVYTIKRDKFYVDGGYMYQIKSGLYISANTKYVEEV